MTSASQNDGVGELAVVVGVSHRLGRTQVQQRERFVLRFQSGVVVVRGHLGDGVVGVVVGAGRCGHRERREHSDRHRCRDPAKHGFTSPVAGGYSGIARQISVRMAGAPSTGAGSSGVGATPPAAIRSRVRRPSGRTRAEDRVVRSQRRVGEDQEELAAVGVRPGVGHGEDPAGVDLPFAGRVGGRGWQVGRQLVLVPVARAAGAGAGRVAALQHLQRRVRGEPVADGPVVEPVPHQVHEALHGARRLRAVEPQRDEADVGDQGGVDGAVVGRVPRVARQRHRSGRRFVRGLGVLAGSLGHLRRRLRGGGVRGSGGAGHEQTGGEHRDGEPAWDHVVLH